MPTNEKFPPKVIVRTVNEKGFFNEETSRRPSALLKPRSILILDSFRGHITNRLNKTVANQRRIQHLHHPRGTCRRTEESAPNRAVLLQAAVDSLNAAKELPQPDECRSFGLMMKCCTRSIPRSADKQLATLAAHRIMVENSIAAGLVVVPEVVEGEFRHVLQNAAAATITHQAYGKKLKRPWKARQKASEKDIVPGSPVTPEKEDSAGTSCTSHSSAHGVNALSAHVSSYSKDHIHTVYCSVKESTERAANAGNAKEHLASQSATEQKFKLLDVNMVSDGDDSGTDFMTVDLSIMNLFLGLVPCPESGKKTVTFIKAPGKEYGLGAKLVLACSTLTCAKTFFSLRATGDAKITPFEVNVRAMKAIQSIVKGATALFDFFATMKP
ncbi:hypothetical protein HPB47_025324 [Ixodes persulcatus]|uniref:Uncharacterized protein n=1 Tax=Ixodes persulcatus TaxID=34615 RepID=A0AC60Q1S7_IXOPE|nr:hypothetical protein HPB47_025324 [Ixodes persulcatus]